MATVAILARKFVRPFLFYVAFQTLLFWAAAAYLAFLFRGDGPGMTPLFLAVLVWFLLQVGSLMVYFGSGRLRANPVHLRLHTLLAAATMVAVAIYMAA